MPAVHEFPVSPSPDAPVLAGVHPSVSARRIESMTEHHVRVARTARYFTIGSAGEALRELWFVLHGYGQLAERFLRSFRGLDDGTRLIVAPEGLSRYYIAGTNGHVGASWMTKVDRDHEIDDYVAFLDAAAGTVLTGVDRSGVRVVLLGFSQGAATTARWAVRGAIAPDAVVLWGGMLPPEIDPAEAPERLPRLHYVVGTADEYRDDEAIAREHERLRSAGIPFSFVEFDGTHRIDAAALDRVAAGITSS